MVKLRVSVANPAELLTVTVTDFVPVVAHVKFTAFESDAIFGLIMELCPSACHV